MSDRQEHLPNSNQPQVQQTAVNDVKVGGNFTIETITQNITQIVIKETGDRPPKVIKIDWREVCSKVLKKQEENQRLRRKATELGFELNVYVPLGLVERKQQQRRSASDDVERERVYQLSEEVITKEYEHDAFLNEVIGVHPTDNKHVAIVGEPGAGKTTLLTKIADWIDKNEKGLPIYISLANLQKKSLEDYLLEVWLEEALALNCIDSEARRYKEAVEESLKERFYAGGVWLLLDGLDEMAVSSSSSALAKIQRELSGWIAGARVALTSRLNVWDFSLNNPLANFETYRTLEFSQKDVNKFIKDWFAAANNELLGTQLQAELEESQYQRVRELVKNPLRLALLCQTWYYNQGDLPETRAGLYQRFVRDFYREWKSELHPIIWTEQEELNKALGKLSLAGIKSQTRFRLGEQLAVRVMGEQLFKSACDWGWLNLVDRDADTNDPVYAFFHPSFQEYFAATVIEKWDYFLPREHKNKPVKEKQNPGKSKPYRIFEPQWKEVILLWLGRQDVDKEKKNQLIRAMIEFKDGCTPLFFKFFGRRGFYEYRANFLAAAGIAEYKDCDSVERIVEQIIKWSFLDYDIIDSTSWELDPFPDWQTREQGARAALKEMGRTEEIKQLLIKKLLTLLKSTEDEYTRLRLAEGLGEIAIGNSNAIAALEQMLDSTEDKNMRLNVAYYLGKIDPGNSTAISTLLQVFESTGDEFDLNQWSFVLSRLGEIAIGNPNAIAVLEQIIKDTEQKLIKHTHLNVKDFNLKSMDELALRRFDSQLKKIDLGKLREEERRSDFSQRQIFWRAISSSIKIDPGNQIALRALGNYMALSEKVFTFLEEDMIKNLLKIDSVRTTTMQSLEQLIDSAKDEDTYLGAAYNLGKIAPGNSTAISTLLQLLKSTKNNPLFKRVTDSLAEIGIGNPKAIAALEQLLKSAKDETRRTCSLVAECLGKIDPGNETAILTLVQVLKSAKGINLRTIRMLREIAIGNPKAIAVLEQLLDSTEDEDRRWEVAYNLGKIDPGNSTAILTLVQLLESTKDEFIFESLTDSLAEIGIGNPKAITALEQLLKSPKNLLRRSIKQEYDDEYEIFDDDWADFKRELNKFLPAKVAEIIMMFRISLNPDLIKSAQYRYFEMRWQAACALGTIDPGNKTATKVLLRLIKPFMAAREDGYIVNGGLMGIGNPTAITLAIQLIKSTKNSEILQEVTEGLRESLSEKWFAEIVSALKAPINRFWRFHAGYQVTTCYNVIWHCAQNMPYPDFYRAWHKEVHP